MRGISRRNDSGRLVLANSIVVANDGRIDVGERRVQRVVGRRRQLLALVAVSSMVVVIVAVEAVLWRSAAKHVVEIGELRVDVLAEAAAHEYVDEWVEERV